MANVQFDVDQGRPQFGGQNGSNSKSSMVNWLIKKGIVKNDAQANSFLVGLIILNFAISAFVIYYFLF